MRSKVSNLGLKSISKILFIFILFFSLFIIKANAFTLSSLFWANNKVHIECATAGCSLSGGVANVKSTVWGIETWSLTSYIQVIVPYILSFVSLIAVIYIIYAWFRILTWAWEEEVLKKQKSTIFYVVIWITIIWLAYPITKFIIDALSW